jgi:hypothetical protein
MLMKAFNSTVSLRWALNPLLTIPSFLAGSVFKKGITMLTSSYLVGAVTHLRLITKYAIPKSRWILLFTTGAAGDISSQGPRVYLCITQPLGII